MENLLWEVEFDYDAENNGLISVSVSFHREGSTYQLPLMTGMLTVQCFVRRGWTSEQKAACIVSRLRAALGDVIEITYEDGDDDFKMKVKDNPGDPVRDAIAIAGFSKVDSATGEGITGIKDDPGENGVPLLTGYLLIEGVGDSTEGIAQIQLGKKYPLVEVRTFEKVADQIVKELVEAFNEGYAKLGFVAEPWYFGPMVALDEAAGLSIEKVPCPLGLRAGLGMWGWSPRWDWSQFLLNSIPKRIKYRYLSGPARCLIRHLNSKGRRIPLRQRNKRTRAVRREIRTTTHVIRLRR